MKWNKTFVVIAFYAPLAWGGAPRTQRASSQGPGVAHDLRATRKSNKVTLAWSQPRVSADRQSGTGHLVSRVCRDISSLDSTAAKPTACTHPVAEIDPQKTTGAIASAGSSKSNSEISIQFSDTLPEEQKGADSQFAVYTIEVRDNQGRSAGLSNSVWVPLVPMPPVSEFHSQLDARGVFLIWQDEIEIRPSSVQFDYRIYRSEKTSSHRTAIPYWRALIHTRDGDRWTGVDTNIEWEKTYSYWVTPVAKVYAANGNLISEIEGEESAPIVVTTHDIFPPAAPEGLLVVVSHIPGTKFVELIWAPNTEKDVAGYNVYRREEGGQMARINSAPITMLSFQDTNVAAGKKYWYCVSAVDLRANESAKSPEIAGALR